MFGVQHCNTDYCCVNSIEETSKCSGSITKTAIVQCSFCLTIWQKKRCCLLLLNCTSMTKSELFIREYYGVSICGISLFSFVFCALQLELGLLCLKSTHYCSIRVMPLHLFITWNFSIPDILGPDLLVLIMQVSFIQRF